MSFCRLLIRMVLVSLPLVILAPVVFAQDDGEAVEEPATPESTDAADPTDIIVPPISVAGQSDAPPKDADKKPDEGSSKYAALLASLTIFVLAVFVGFEVITKVPPTLHTPLMSGSNAISGITIVGALLATGFSANWFVAFVGMIALVLATINVVGGFLVTHRMLDMFKKKK